MVSFWSLNKEKKKWFMNIWGGNEIMDINWQDSPPLPLLDFTQQIIYLPQLGEKKIKLCAIHSELIFNKGENDFLRKCFPFRIQEF